MNQTILETVIQNSVAKGFSHESLALILEDAIRARANAALGEIIDLNSINFDTRALSEIVMENTKIQNAVQKLQALKGRFPYQTATGRAAMNPKVWIYKTFIVPGYLTLEDIRAIPVSFLRDFDMRLYHAIFNALRKR